MAIQAINYIGNVHLSQGKVFKWLLMACLISWGLKSSLRDAKVKRQFKRLAGGESNFDIIYVQKSQQLG